MSWFVYILECVDGSFYTGIAKDVEARMQAHKDGSGSKYVASHGFKRLLYVLESPSRSEASKVEYAVKQLAKFEKLVFFREHESLVFSVFEP